MQLSCRLIVAFSPPLVDTRVKCCPFDAPRRADVRLCSAVGRDNGTQRLDVQQRLQVSVSRRVVATDPPVIVKTKQLIGGRQGVFSLAQGVVHWAPPPEALQKLHKLMLSDPTLHSYGPADGLPALREALEDKIRKVNGLNNYRVMVTAGANQAFTNLILALCDESDQVILFRPYYFNHLMAIQMTGGADRVVYGPCDPSSFHPDLDWLEEVMQGAQPPKMVVLVNPCNPTGVLLTPAEVQRASNICAKAGAWLILDNTYEQFIYLPEERHFSVAAPHVISVFSFSKAYGMMGWRVGYIAYPDFGGGNLLGQEILKVQDTIPICPTQASQHLALHALLRGDQYVAERVQDLTGNREVLLSALSPLGTLGHGLAGGEGAIYLWAKLPPGCEDDEAVVEWLIIDKGVCIIPGSSCGCPGYVRAAFANLQPVACLEAAGRLHSGLEALTQMGLPPRQQWAAAAV